MSDVLDIDSQFGSEFGEDSDQLTNALKMGAKLKKGRGFVAGIAHRSVLNKKYIFDKLESSETGGGDAIKPKTGVLPQKSIEGWTVFVTGIHEEATEEDLKEFFSEYGNITYFSLNLDRRTGFIKGYAIIEYKTFEEALNTIGNLNDVELLGQSIHVEWAFVKKPTLFLKPARF